jgi:signal transduction histidine kinase
VIKKINDDFENLIYWLGKHNWGVISSILISITLFEIFELLHKEEPLTDPFHVIEFFIYVIILAFVGILINFYITLNANQKHTMEILDYKHQLSLQLLELDDWDELINEMVKLPSSIARVELSKLHVFNPISNEMEVVASWNDAENQESKFRYDYWKCIQTQSSDKTLLNLCSYFNDEVEDSGVHPLEYCLTISSQDKLLGLIQFQLKSGETLSDEQKVIFESIRPEIALALKAAWEHQRLAVLRITETAITERHLISDFLHDNLSQNLAYIILKLEQLTSETEKITESQKKDDLYYMKGAARESYELVRGLLESIRPETTPRLVNLFIEYGNKVSKRSHFETRIEEKGDALPISPDIKRTLFYLFQETLSNVEKHAQAKNVNVSVDWGVDNLHVIISDDGIGFNPQSLKGANHFGLDIMRERIKKINGQLDIQSCDDSGTEVSIWVPIELPKKEGSNV